MTQQITSLLDDTSQAVSLDTFSGLTKGCPAPFWLFQGVCAAWGIDHSRAWSVATAPTSLTAVEVWADGGVQVEFVNDTHHLYDPAFADDVAQLEAQVRILDSSLEGPPA